MWTWTIFRYGEHLTNYENKEFQERLAVLRATMNTQAFQIKTACRLAKFKDSLGKLMTSSSFDTMKMEAVSSSKRR
jgi:hypothetical protein